MTTTNSKRIVAILGVLAVLSITFLSASIAHADIRPCIRITSASPWGGGTSAADFSMYNTMSASFTRAIGR